MNFKTVNSITIPQIDILKEEYQIQQKNDRFNFTINVSAENIDKMFLEFAKCIKTPGFIILEVPSNLNYERQFQLDGIKEFHREVFYLDGLEWVDFLVIHNNFSEYFINDGLVCYGFGSQVTNDEIFIGKYKIFSIWSKNVEPFECILK
jgi:hypothetical protein